jgi:DNA repair protein RadC
LETIYEITKIKQVRIEIQNELKQRLLEPTDVVQIAHYFIGDDDREILLVICLNAHHKIIAVHRCHIGSLTATIVSSREVFKACILNNASYVILAHNHPSMNLQPSQTDITLTQLLEKSGKILDIPLLDHLIINQKGGYFSFQDSGYLTLNSNLQR